MRLTDNELRQLELAAIDGELGQYFAAALDAITELRAHRAAALTAEEREALEHTHRDLVAAESMNTRGGYEPNETRLKALAVLSRLLAGGE